MSNLQNETDRDPREVEAEAMLTALRLKDERAAFAIGLLALLRPMPEEGGELRHP